MVLADPLSWPTALTYAKRTKPIISAQKPEKEKNNMPIFWAQSVGGKQHMGSEYLRNKYAEDLAKNPGARYKIERITPESRDQRGFFEGAVITLWSYLNGADHHDHETHDIYRDLVKLEFNSDTIVVDGKPRKIGRSTKGKLKNGLVDKVIDYLEEQYAIKREDVLNTADYKNWRDVLLVQDETGTIPQCYICYLEYDGRLKRPELSTTPPLHDNNRLL